jgi:hypothetical protein
MKSNAVFPKLQDDCKVCPEGYFCDSAVQNDTFCAHGVSNPTPCPAASYCPNGTRFGTEFLCPNGTFSDITHLKSTSECSQCPGGQYCGQEGLTTPSGDCSAGYYCIGGASSSTPTDGITGDICPMGAYCPTGSNQTTLCPPGTFGSATGWCW